MAVRYSKASAPLDVVLSIQRRFFILLRGLRVENKANHKWAGSGRRCSCGGTETERWTDQSGPENSDQDPNSRKTSLWSHQALGWRPSLLFTRSGHVSRFLQEDLNAGSVRGAASSADNFTSFKISHSDKMSIKSTYSTMKCAPEPMMFLRPAEGFDKL